jgi:hypothetical protein
MNYILKLKHIFFILFLQITQDQLQMSLPPASAEQTRVIEAVLAGHNVCVSAVAGSGKTTTMLHIAKQTLDTKNVLILTYNARLKDEVRAKVERLGLNNTEAHSYHAFFVRYYNNKCCTDAGILDVLDRDEKPRTSFRYGIVILDEVQDMTPLYLRAVRKILLDMTANAYSIQEPTENNFNDWDEPDMNVLVAQTIGMTTNDDDFDFTSTASDNSVRRSIAVVSEVQKQVADSEVQKQVFEPQTIRVQLCLFGDPCQNIYAFKEADDRFLTLCEKIWAGFPRINPVWKSLPLSQSFRVTKQIARFVNESCLGQNRIVSEKNGSKVKYLICNSFGTEPTKHILALLKRYKPGDIFIIAPSIRANKSPIKKLENNLVKAEYPCFVPVADDEILQQDVIAGKIVFSSIHQTKGLERKVVMLFNYDESYFKFFNKDDEPSICPNALYVACTRAAEELILVHERTKKFLPFLNQATVYDHCEMHIHNFSPKPIESPERSKFSVIDLTRHLTVETMNRLLAGVRTLEPVGLGLDDFVLSSPIAIPTTIRGTVGDESVSDINGICLPSIYEYKTQTHVSIIEYIKAESSRLPKRDQLQIAYCMPKFEHGGKPDLRDFLYLSIVYNSLRTGYLFKLRQIEKYDWLEAEACKQALQVVKHYIPNNARFEKQLEGELIIRDIPRLIIGCLDSICFQHGSIFVWEFKCVKELQPEHIMQVMVYMWLFMKNHDGKHPVRFCLLNILTNQVIEIIRPDNLDEIIRELVTEKIKIRHRTTDDEFLESFSYKN